MLCVLQLKAPSSIISGDRIHLLKEVSNLLVPPCWTGVKASSYQKRQEIMRESFYCTNHLKAKYAERFSVMHVYRDIIVGRYCVSFNKAFFYILFLYFICNIWGPPKRER